MSVSNGQQANDTTFNNAFLSRTALNEDVTGTFNLKNPTSGADVNNVQQTINTARTDIANAQVDIVSLQNTKVTGPSSATDNALVRYDGTTGKLVKDSNVTVDDSGNVTIVGDVTIGGNTTINGTSTVINTATLDVEDQNVTVNKGGNDSTADGAGLTVDRSSTDGSLVYDSTKTSKWKLGNLGSEVEVADVSSTQTLTNKTIAANTNTITTNPSGNLTSTELTPHLLSFRATLMPSVHQQIIFKNLYLPLRVI